MSERIEELTAAIIKSIKDRTGRFLESHQASRDFLEERARRMATLVDKYAEATDDASRDAIRREMEAVTLSIETEALNVASDVEPATRSWWKDVVRLTFGAIKEFAPILIKKVF